MLVRFPFFPVLLMGALLARCSESDATATISRLAGVGRR